MVAKPIVCFACHEPITSRNGISIVYVEVKPGTVTSVRGSFQDQARERICCGPACLVEIAQAIQIALMEKAARGQSMIEPAVVPMKRRLLLPPDGPTTS